MNYDKIYEYRFLGIPDQKKVAVWRKVSRHIQKFMPGAEKILDPCAGKCEFANHVEAGEVWAIDRESGFLELARPGIKTLVGDVFDVPLPDGYFNGIYVSNFLEHLQNAEHVSKFLRKMYAALAPGGRIVIMGPNFKYCAGEYFDCIDHTLILTHHSVEEMLYSENFALVKTHPRYLPYSFRGRLGASPAAAILAGLYLKFPPAWVLFGKQFLIVAEKPRG